MSRKPDKQFIAIDDEPLMNKVERVMGEVRKKYLIPEKIKEGFEDIIFRREKLCRRIAAEGYTEANIAERERIQTEFEEAFKNLVLTPLIKGTLSELFTEK